MSAPICGLCKVPIATEPCTHVLVANGQVTMSEASWVRLCTSLHDARNRLAELQEESKL